MPIMGGAIRAIINSLRPKINQLRVGFPSTRGGGFVGEQNTGTNQAIWPLGHLSNPYATILITDHDTNVNRTGTLLNGALGGSRAPGLLVRSQAVPRRIFYVY